MINGLTGLIKNIIDIRTKDLEGKKLLILGGIRQMLEVVETAHAMGIIVYVTDYQEDSPCKKVADKSFMVNAIDVDAVVELCRKEGIDGILTGYVDMLLPYYAEICEKTGLPCYATKEQFDKILNKKIIKEICRTYNVPVAREYSKEDEITFPVIVKPADGSGSRGISVCNNIEELNKAINDSLAYSKKKDYVIEDYLSDGKVLMHYYVQDGKPILMGLADQYMVKVYDDKIPMASCLLYPSKHLKTFLEQEDQNIKNMIRSLGIKNGTIELETYPRDGQLYIGDIGFRLCGSRAQYIFGDAFGVFSPELLIRFAITGVLADYDIESKVDLGMNGKHYGKINLAIRPGKINHIKGLEELDRFSPVYHVALLMSEGDELPMEDRGKLRQIVSRIFFKADSLDEYEKAAEYIYNTIDFLDADGRSLKLPTSYYHECVLRYQSDMSNMITGGFEH